ncbi:MAG: hypothetical protein ON057_001598 [Glomeribacter sp. 1016415]|nr:hypothetical protein [Glomeribacter sp. 1016415]
MIFYRLAPCCGEQQNKPKRGKFLDVLNGKPTNLLAFCAATMLLLASCATIVLLLPADLAKSER